MDLVNLIEQVRKSAYDVYKELGAGYNESIYEEALAIELRERKIPYEVERNTEIFYKGQKVGIHRLDFILDDKLVVELKAEEDKHDTFKAQILWSQNWFRTKFSS